EMAATTHQLVPDDTSLERRAAACKPHVAPSPPAPGPPPAPPAPATLDDASQALAHGELGRALEIAERLLKASPDDLAATRIAALAACGLKNVDKATHYAAKLRGTDRTEARNRCRASNIELDGAGSATEPDDNAPDDELAAAVRAASAGQWD